jgi:lipopolysaccharide/colanic/teichoic acid biosynthesis glycosyltransferase
MNIILKPLVLIGLILISPIIFISLFLVWLEDGSPVIFVQERLGLSKNKFKILKIRTMYKSAPNLGTHEVANAYYLNIGSIIRKIKIDELPQLVNYLKGELELIGPRPGLPSQVKLKEYRDAYNIFNIKPGITGLAQVLGYDMSNPRALAMIDSLYIKNRSIQLDVKIFFATFFNSYRAALYLSFENEIKQIIEKDN